MDTFIGVFRGEFISHIDEICDKLISEIMNTIRINHKYFNRSLFLEDVRKTLKKFDEKMICSVMKTVFHNKLPVITIIQGEDYDDMHYDFINSNARIIPDKICDIVYYDPEYSEELYISYMIFKYIVMSYNVACTKFCNWVLEPYLIPDLANIVTEYLHNSTK